MGIISPVSSSIAGSVPVGTGHAFTLVSGAENSKNAGKPQAHGAFSIFVGGQAFEEIWDPVVSLGYNFSIPSGLPGRILQSEPSSAWVIEGDFKFGAERLVEVYNETVTDATLAEIEAGAAPEWRGGVRPFFAHFLRGSATPELFVGENGVLGSPVSFLVPDNTVAVNGVRIVASFGKENLFTFGGELASNKAKAGKDTIIKTWAAAGQNSKILLSSEGVEATTSLLTETKVAFSIRVNANKYEFREAALKVPGGIGFFGHSVPGAVTKVGPAASSLLTVETLANNMRTALIACGIIAE